ncbi:MAG: hypothetical protein [Cressdnaviricota sp.]|nr:MAG: hypothetical protein [Cressdnaviricota sp.]
MGPYKPCFSSANGLGSKSILFPHLLKSYTLAININIATVSTFFSSEGFTHRPVSTTVRSTIVSLSHLNSPLVEHEHLCMCPVLIQ